MIKIKSNSIFGDATPDFEYLNIESFLEDFVDDSVIRDWLTEIYDTIEIPIVGKIPAGDLLYALRQQGYEVFWDDLIADYFMSETEYIEDELAFNGELEWNGYLIYDSDFNMQGNDACL